MLQLSSVEDFAPDVVPKDSLSVESLESESDSPGVRVGDGIGGVGLEQAGPPPSPSFDLEAWRTFELARLRRAAGYQTLPPYTKKLATYLIRRYYQPKDGIIVSQVTLERELRGTKLQRTRKIIREHLKRLVAAGLFTEEERYRPAHWKIGGRSSNRYRVSPKLPSQLPSQLPSEGLTTEGVSEETKENSLRSLGAGSHSSPTEAKREGQEHEVLFDGRSRARASLDRPEAGKDNPAVDPQSKPLLNERTSTTNLVGGASVDSAIMPTDVHPEHCPLSLVELDGNLDRLERAPGSRSPFTAAQRRRIASVHPWLSDDWARHVLITVARGEEWDIHIENPAACFWAGICSGKRPQ
jgi:hypothetical protein